MVRLGENLPLSSPVSLSLKKIAMFPVCARYKRALMTQEIMRRKDAQCNSMESH